MSFQYTLTALRAARGTPPVVAVALLLLAVLLSDLLLSPLGIAHGMLHAAAIVVAWRWGSRALLLATLGISLALIAVVIPLAPAAAPPEIYLLNRLLSAGLLILLALFLAASGPGASGAPETSASPASISSPAPETSGSPADVLRAPERDGHLDLELVRRVDVLKALADEIGDDLIVVDSSGRVLMMNASARAHLGVDAEAVARRNWAEVFEVRAPDGTPLAQEQLPIERALRGESINRQEVLIRDASRVGIDLEMEATAIPLRDAQGAPSGADLILHDLSRVNAAERARAAAEDELSRARRLEALGQLTGGVAHDFNNLLTVILGNADLLLDRLELAEGDRELLDMIVDAGRRGAALNGRLLAFARRQPLEPEPVRVDELLASTGQMLQRILDERIRVRVRIEPSTPAVLADPSELANALLNLAVNARDAMSDGGVLTLYTARPERHECLDADCLVLGVRDTGAGMDPETLQRVFEPFFSTKDPGRGTGLGLSQVHGFVGQSAGDIRILTEPGEGTDVRLVLPTTDQLPRPGASRPPKVVPGNSTSLHVLVVEDDPALRVFVQAALVRSGHEVTAVADATMATRVFDPGQHDLLVTDVALPDRTGAELLRELRRSHPTPALLMSGWAEFEAGEVLPAPLLRKPFTAEELLQEIHGAVS